MKRLLLFGLIISLTGCGATLESAGKYKLLANISKDDSGKYHIDNFSNDAGNVDFNHVEYLGNKTPIDCRRVNCEKTPPEFYRNKNVHPVHELGGGLGSGVDSSVSYKRQEFANSSFKNAVAEALITSKIDRNKIIAEFDLYVDRHDNKVDTFTLPPEKFGALLKQ